MTTRRKRQRALREAKAALQRRLRGQRKPPKDGRGKGKGRKREQVLKEAEAALRRRLRTAPRRRATADSHDALTGDIEKFFDTTVPKFVEDTRDRAKALYKEGEGDMERAEYKDFVKLVNLIEDSVRKAKRLFDSQWG